MTSKERMLNAINCEDVDYVPCSFMLFFNLYNRCKTDLEFAKRELELGLDPYVHVGHLNHTMHLHGALHPDTRISEWVEVKNGIKYFYRRIDTPAGPLTQKVRVRSNWPNEDDFPIFSDWIVPRAEEILVKPEKDLEKLKYIFGPFKDSDIEVLKEEATNAKRFAEEHQLLLVGGWKGTVRPGLQVDPGVMGCDAMAWLSGYEEIMVLSVIKPEIIKEYVEIIHRWNMKQIEIYLDVTDAELIIRRGWYETTEFWTPKVYKEIIAPTIKEEAELVHQAGRKFGYIITSAFLQLVDDIIDSGIDVLIGLDPLEGKGTDMKKVKEKFSKAKRAIWGGVSGAITIEMGSGDDVDTAVKAAINILGKGGGFILSPVDNVREDTELAWKNTYRFIGSWKKYRTIE